MLILRAVRFRRSSSLTALCSDQAAILCSDQAAIKYEEEYGQWPIITVIMW